jgi:FAD:protein FMN transferase
VPSLQATGAADVPAEGAAAAGAAAGVAAEEAAGAEAEAAPPDVVPPLAVPAADFDLSMPPCPLQAPRPPWGEGLPSLQVTGVSLVPCAAAGAPARISAALRSALHIRSGYVRLFIFYPPLVSDRVSDAAEYRNPQACDISEPRAPRCRVLTLQDVQGGGMSMRTAWLSFGLIVAALPRAAPAAWMERTEAIMGTRVYVQLWTEDEAAGDAAMGAVMTEMRRIDDLMSHYKPESQLSQINARANSEPVQVDKELFDLIKLSTHYSQITEGAFDITYASVGYLYDYPRHIHPTEAQIRAALPGVNWRNMLLDEAHHTVRFEHPGMRIDVGGIGKGYAVDRCIELLKARGIRHALVTAGGDSRILGDHLGRPWLVAIRHPDDPNKVVTHIPLSDTAMSTSGDYERYFIENGVRYHHIIDPRTGHSASKVRSATILAPTATQTDGMSKTAFVLGAQKTLEIINRMPEYDAVFVTPQGRVLYSNGLRPAKPRPAGAPSATATSPRVPP